MFLFYNIHYADRGIWRLLPQQFILAQILVRYEPHLHCKQHQLGLCSPGSFPNLTPNPTGTEAQESPRAEDFTKELCSEECVLVPLVQCGHCPPAALINSPKLLLKGISQDFLEQHKILLHIMLLHISHSAYTGIVSHADKMCHFYDKQPRNNNSSIF